MNKTIEELFLSAGKWLTLRLDCHPTEDQVSKTKEYFKTHHLIYGNEQKKDGTPHTHIVFSYSKTISPHKIRTHINKVYDLHGPEFTTSKVRTSIYKSIQYCVKDQDVTSENFPDKWVSNIMVQSTKKYDKDDFKQNLEIIENRFYQDTYDQAQFAFAFVSLRNQYGQKPNDNSITNYLKFHLIKKNKTYRKAYANSMLERAHQQIMGN